MTWTRSYVVQRAYKLFTVRKDGSIGSLFINRKARLPIGVWMEAESHPTKGYAFRPMWHATEKPIAPHLSMNGRQWFEVEIRDFEEFQRPDSQGGKWFLAKGLQIDWPLELCSICGKPFKIDKAQIKKNICFPCWRRNWETVAKANEECLR